MEITSNFKVDDEVIINRKDDLREGKVGTIVDITTSGYILVNISTNYGITELHTFTADELILVHDQYKPISKPLHDWLSK